ncbi:testis-specific serine/threonine-protein kinase 4-like [Limulus polyphemus]|uniref:Testis-specific serine/threonine-protein kinase 4-like n=1 Tax=Limulus polyphemus TaxID=6850 RepID=A0ABM1TGU1_LIMPO|nr:testis-specific serine/threonine-protein kinase 4-like [Limulus polyphemus]
MSNDKVECEKRRTVLEALGYEVGGTLGHGSYSVVKMAHSQRYLQVAMKIISKRKAPKDFLEKFLPREIYVIRFIRHENIVTFFETIETVNRYYIVMELAVEDLLERIQKENVIEENKACKWFHNLVDGVAHCHERGIVHRDLKCENLLLDSNDVLKITDFGFAKFMDEVIPTDENDSSTSLSHTFCGSYAYAPPEILTGIPYLPHLSDIWSMGVILFAMVYGQLPFNDSNHQMLIQQVQTPVVFPSNTVSTEVKNIINKMLVPANNRIYIEDIRSDSWYNHI